MEPINAVGMHVLSHQVCVYRHTTVLIALSSLFLSSAYDPEKPFTDLLNTAMVHPIFDGGNVGIRRRHIQELVTKPTYGAWASTYGPTSSSS